jgi:hypothetical protein
MLGNSRKSFSKYGKFYDSPVTAYGTTLKWTGTTS